MNLEYKFTTKAAMYCNALGMETEWFTITESPDYGGVKVSIKMMAKEGFKYIETLRQWAFQNRIDNRNLHGQRIGNDNREIEVGPISTLSADYQQWLLYARAMGKTNVINALAVQKNYELAEQRHNNQFKNDSFYK